MILMEGCRQAFTDVQRCDLILFVKTGVNEKKLKLALIVSLINTVGEKKKKALVNRYEIQQQGVTGQRGEKNTSLMGCWRWE